MDYDNSLGNAVGIANELKSIKVYDYEEYTGWWCKYKGLSSGTKTSSNIMNRFAQNTPILNRAKTIWNEKFIPAINHFTGNKLDEEIDKEFYTADNYFSLIEKNRRDELYERLAAQYGQVDCRPFLADKGGVR